MPRTKILGGKMPGQAGRRECWEAARKPRSAHHLERTKPGPPLAGFDAPPNISSAANRGGTLDACQLCRSTLSPHFAAHQSPVTLLLRRNAHGICTESAALVGLLELDTEDDVRQRQLDLENRTALRDVDSLWLAAIITAFLIILRLCTDAFTAASARGESLSGELLSTTTSFKSPTSYELQLRTKGFTVLMEDRGILPGGPCS